MGRDDDGVPSREVDVNSRPRQANYSRGNFSVTSSPHQWGHGGSLGPAFTPGSLTVKDPVRPAFGLALYGGFPTRLSWPLGPLDIFSRGRRPSQTAHLLLSPGLAPRLGVQPWKGGVSSAPPQPPEGLAQRLPPTLRIHSHTPTTGCSKAPRGLLTPLGDGGLFTTR